MKTINNSIINSLYRNLTFIVFLTIYLIGLRISADYGISFDENVRRIGAKSHAKEFVEYFGYKNSNFNNIPQVKENLHAYTGPYGMVYEFPALLFELIIGPKNTKTVFLTRHKLIFTFHFIGIIVFFLFAKELFGSSKKAIFSTLIYSLHPRIFAHSFFNPKDIIFLSLVTISLYPILKFFKTKNNIWIIPSSIIIGLAISCRIVAIYLPFLFILFYLTLIIIDKPKKNQTFSYVIFGLSIITISFLTTYIATPYFWFDPIDRFIEAFQRAKLFPWSGSVFFLGENISARILPWYYIIIWFLITTPIIYIIFFILGFIFLVKNLKTCLRKNLIIIFCLFGLLIPFIAAIILGSTLYDGWRHFYFTYVFISIIASYGVFELYRIIQFNNRTYSQIILFIVFFFGPFFNLVHMHPYQQVYFNYFGGSDPMLRFEGDYYGSSYRQGLEYILKNDSSDKIFIQVENAPGTINRHILSNKDRSRLVFDFMPEWRHKPDYFITNFRGPFGHDKKMYIQAKSKEEPFNDEFFSINIKNMKILGVYKTTFD